MMKVHMAFDYNGVMVKDLFRLFYPSPLICIHVITDESGFCIYIYIT